MKKIATYVALLLPSVASAMDFWNVRVIDVVKDGESLVLYFQDENECSGLCSNPVSKYCNTLIAEADSPVGDVLDSIEQFDMPLPIAYSHSDNTCIVEGIQSHE